MSQQVYFGYGKAPVGLALDKLNRHGIIAGATGTGKTVTLKVIAEQLSLAGVPVFLSDIKGDLASITEPGSSQEVAERLKETNYDNFETRTFPIELWDALGENGIPIRVTVSEMGPILLARLLGLNDTQTSILNVVFSVADDEGLLLIDLMDLRAMLNYVGEQAKELKDIYGSISKASIGVILRSIKVLEDQGGDVFFAEPSLDIKDFIKTNDEGLGMINILDAVSLYQTPFLYATVLLALLSELYETLPEVGDLDKPKLVFFFDEAHVLFNNAPTFLIEKIELVVRLIRSKGVSVFFVTQNPTDIPDKVSSQLANRIQHGLRAYTPKELKVVNAVADTFRQDVDSDIDLATTIQELATGEAVVSHLDAEGTPTIAEKVMVYPPMSKLGVIDSQVKLQVINHSTLLDKYSEAINRESAHEQLNNLIEEREQALIQEADPDTAKMEPTKEDTSQDRIKELEEKLAKQIKESKSSSRKSNRDTSMDRFTKNVMSQVGREVGRIVSRSILGMFKK